MAVAGRRANRYVYYVYYPFVFSDKPRRVHSKLFSLFYLLAWFIFHYLFSFVSYHRRNLALRILLCLSDPFARANGEHSDSERERYCAFCALSVFFFSCCFVWLSATADCGLWLTRHIRLMSAYSHSKAQRSDDRDWSSPSYHVCPYMRTSPLAINGKKPGN